MATSFAKIQEHHAKIPMLKATYTKGILPEFERLLEQEIETRLSNPHKKIFEVAIIVEFDKELLDIGEVRRYFAERYKDWPALSVSYALFGGLRIALYSYVPKKK